MFVSLWYFLYRMNIKKIASDEYIAKIYSQW